MRRGAGRPGDPPCRGVSGLQCEGRTASGSEGGGKQRARCSPRAALFVKGVSGEDRSPGLEAGRGDPECTVNCVAPPRRERGGGISFIFFLDRCLVRAPSMLLQRQDHPSLHDNLLRKSSTDSWLRLGHMPLKHHFSFPFYAVF